MKKLVTPGLPGRLCLKALSLILIAFSALDGAAQCIDLAPPVPVCNLSLAIPLNNTGTALIPASVFDAGSMDDCGHVFFKVKRMSLPVGYTCANPGNPDNLFDDFIQFCCEDIANNEIMVILRVYDEPPVPGPVPDDYLEGNFNDCMVQVEVQDKLPPEITCPSPLTISCIFPFSPDNLSVFGEVATTPEEQDSICINDPGVPGNPGIQCIGFDGLATDNCNVEISEESVVNINNCGLGSIVRTFTATDDGGLEVTCQQVISVINFNPFDLSDIVWPPDFTTTNICEIDSLDPDDLPPPFNEPVLTEGPCDLVAASYEDMVFDFSNLDEACFKILRTWTVIDWCQLNTQTGGIWTHLQVIKVMNNIDPVIEPLEDIVECSFDPECGGLTLNLEAEATDDCSGPNSLTWTYTIDLENDNIFDFISPAIVGDSVAFSFEFPIGEHRVLFSVSDQCGNQTTEEQLITIESCKGPSAKCIHGLSANLMAMDLDGDGTPDWGMVAIHAEMFDAGSDHPCGNEITLAFSEDPTDVTRIFDCTDLGANEVELWVIDENGLTDFCITTIEIQDNSDVCPPGQGITGVISGNLSVPGSGQLGGAMIYLDGSNLPGIQSGLNGFFAFPAMPFGGQYVVRPTKGGDDRNGVTTLDLVKMQKHLLGLVPFDSPYQFIAADANNSNSVSAIDIIQLRQLILGYYDELPNNESWRFVDQNHIFPDTLNPWTTPWNEVYTISPFQSNMPAVNFNAIKIGDINLSASLNAGHEIILPRNGELCEIEYAVTQEAEAGIYRIDMKLLNAEIFSAVQFSFDWNFAEYELVDWAPGENISAEEIRISSQADQPSSLGIITTSGWQGKSQMLMTMWVSKRKINASPFKLFLKPTPTQPVAYALESGDESNIHLIRKINSPFHISNQPNPFKEWTTIHFISSDIEEGVMRISDMGGKVVYMRNITLTKGDNEFLVKKSDLRGIGMYVYEIKTPLQHRTNRMIVVD